MAARLVVLLALLAAACTKLPDPREWVGWGSLRPDAVPSIDLSAPAAVRAHSGELRAVPLSWKPVLAGEVEGYVVERAGEDGEFARVGAVRGRFAVTFVDRDPTLADGTSYRYRVRSVTADGGVGVPVSPVVEGTTAPLPAPPKGLEATSHQPRRVALQWRPSSDLRVVGYVVERSPAADGPFLPVATTTDRFATSWVDRGLGDLRVFYYRVSAVNAGGGRGEPGPAVQAVTKAEPLPPIGLRVAEKRLGSNRLAWEPNVEEDVAGYRLLRRREGAARPETVATLAPGTVEAEDAAVAADETVTYRVVAFDADGLESAPSDAVSVRSEGYGLEAGPDPDGIALRWNPRVKEGFAAARVFRVGRLRRRELARVEGARFVDTEVEPGRTYRYAVVLERDDGTRAPPSSVVQSAPATP